MAKAKTAVKYDEKAIQTLDAPEHIRLRTGMYIGRLGDGSNPMDGINILLKEVIDKHIQQSTIAESIETPRACREAWPLMGSGRTGRGTRREAERRIGREDPRHDQAEPERANEKRSPGSSLLLFQQVPHIDGARDSEQSRENEARDLDPPKVSETQLADGVGANVVPGPSEDLHDGDTKEHWARGNAAGQQRPGRT